jgi:Putative peptidoglycan binding domain
MPMKRAVVTAVKVLLAVAVVVAVGVVGFQAGKRAVDTAPPVPETAAPVVVTLSDGTLVDTDEVPVTARWVPVASYLHRRSGTVTSSFMSAGTRTVIDAGTVLYSVDGGPVIAVRGAVPAFRTMGPTMVGDDITQFQQFLADLGILTAPVDGRWGAATTAALRAWQDQTKRPRSAVVELGSIVFMATLPTAVSADPTLTVGALASEGSTAFYELSPVPRFAVVVSPDANGSITGGLGLRLTVGATPLEFSTADTETVDEAGVMSVDLKPDSSSNQCGSWCDAIATGRPTQLSGTVTRAGPLAGVIAPIGALRSGAGDDLFVVTGAGVEVPVSVTLRVGANAIVEGVPAGTEIQLPVAAAVPSG